jgi:hypothetical protein
MSVKGITVINVYEDILNMFGDSPYVEVLKPYEQKLSELKDHSSVEGFKKSFAFAKNIGKESVKKILRTYFGSPDNEWFSSIIQKVEELGFGTVGSEFVFPVAESLDECIPLANIMIIFGLLDIPFRNSKKPASFTTNKQFERDLTNVTSWLMKIVSDKKCTKIRPYDREKPVRNNVNILKSLVLRDQYVENGTYSFVNKMIKDYCGETVEGKNLGLSFVLQTVPRELKEFFRKCLNCILRKLTDTLVIPGSYYSSVASCLNWHFKVTKKGKSETVSTKIKPHTSNSIRYFPNDLRGVKNQLMPETNNFNDWFQHSKNEVPTEKLVSEGNSILSRSYAEFYLERRFFRESYYAYCNKNNVNINDFEDTYCASSHFLRTVIPVNNHWYKYTNEISGETQQGTHQKV